MKFAIAKKNSLIFAVSHLKFTGMETAAVTPRASSYTPKREVTPEKKVLSRAEKRRLGDEYFISQIDEGLKTKRVSLDEVLAVLRK